MIVYDILLVFGLILFGGVCWAFWRHPAASFYHPATIYLVMHGIVFAVRPVLARIFDYRLIYEITQFNPSVSDKITVLVAADLALVVFTWISLKIAPQPVRIQWSREKIRQREILWVPFIVVASVITPIALYSVIQDWLVTSTNASSMKIDPATGVFYNTAANGWLQSAQLAMVPLVAVFAWLTRFRWWSLVPFAIFFVLRAGTGERGPIVVAAVAIVTLFLLDRDRKWPEWRGALLIGIVALAFNAIVADRGKAVREAFISDQAYQYDSPYESKPFEHMDFGNMEYFEFAVYAVPQRSGTFDYFLHNLQILTEPVPRIWWKDKPLGPPIAMYRLPDYGRPYGFTYSVPGIGWMAWGWPGVAIQAALFALIFGGLHRRLATGPQTPIFILVFTLMIASNVVSYRDGTLLTIVRNLPFYIGPIAAVWFVSLAFRSKRPATHRIRGRERADQDEDLSPADRRKALARLADQPG